MGWALELPFALKASNKAVTSCTERYVWEATSEASNPSTEEFLLFDWEEKTFFMSEQSREQKNTQPLGANFPRCAYFMVSNWG